MNIRKISKNQHLSIKSYYKKTIDQSFIMWPHTHSYMEIMKVISGKIYLDIFEGNTLIKTEAIVANNLIIINKSKYYHRIRTESTATILNLEFEIKSSNIDVIRTAEYITTSQEWNDIINSPYGISIFNDLNDVQKTIESILNKIDNIFFIQNENILLESLIIHLLIKIADSFSKIKTKNKIGGAYLNKVITIIHRDIGSNISVNKIAEEINVSASYLQRIFKLHFSTSIMKYINNIRLQLAKNHLVNTNDSINQILKKYGFRSKQQFVYQFKSIYQMTPVQFRNAYFTQILPDNSIEYQEKSIKVD